jgi:hypothetical protein
LPLNRDRSHFSTTRGFRPRRPTCASMVSAQPYPLRGHRRSEVSILIFMLLLLYSLCPSPCTPRRRCRHKFPPPSSLPSGGSSPWSLHYAPPGSFLLRGWLPSPNPQAIELPSVHHLKHTSDVLDLSGLSITTEDHWTVPSPPANFHRRGAPFSRELLTHFFPQISSPPHPTALAPLADPPHNWRWSDWPTTVSLMPYCAPPQP